MSSGQQADGKTGLYRRRQPHAVPESAQRSRPVHPVDLAVQCGRPLLARQPFAPDAFDQVILGCVNVIADEMNPARVAALRLGMGEAMVAFTVQINCGSGMQSIDTGYRYIREGNADLILAGGAEALSHAPLVWPQNGVRWFAGLADGQGCGRASVAALAKAAAGLSQAGHRPRARAHRSDHRPQYGPDRRKGRASVRHHPRAGRCLCRRKPQAPCACAGTGLAEGRSRDRLRRATAISTTTTTACGADSSVDKLGDTEAGVRTAVGQVTAGNSSQITDGASWVILASEEAVAKHGLTPKAVIVDSQWSALDPVDHGARSGVVVERPAEAQQHDDSATSRPGS